MENLAPAKHQNTIIAKTLYRKIKVNNGIKYILHLPSGQRIITCSVNGSFQVWDLERGTQLLDEWKEKAAGVEAIALSPGGKTVATGSNDGTLKLWNVNTGKVAKTLTGHRARVHSVCWNRDGERVTSGCWGGTFRVWDVESGETIIGPIKAGGDVQTVCYSPDGKMIAISLYTVLKIWDANTGELLKTIDDVCCRCLAWTWDGKALFAGGWRIRKFDTATWTAVLDGGENFVDTILLSPNRRIVATTSYFDKTAQLWNLETNQPIGTPFHHEDFVISATFSADGKFLWCIIYSRRDGSFRVWDLEKGTQVGEEWEVKDNEVEAMALSPDSKTVATGGWDGAVKLWDTNKGRVIKTLTGHTREAKSVCWSSNGRRVVSGSWDGTFRVWDIESGETILGPIEGGGYIWAVCYSPDGKTIATAGDWLKIWDANSGKLL
ncbi:hypothetical protein BDR07DRAFT_1334837, partial [Suillus spraguei]